jgi:hypothetical protein
MWGSIYIELYICLACCKMEDEYQDISYFFFAFTL